MLYIHCQFRQPLELKHLWFQMFHVRHQYEVRLQFLLLLWSQRHLSQVRHRALWHRLPLQQRLFLSRLQRLQALQEMQRKVRNLSVFPSAWPSARPVMNNFPTKNYGNLFTALCQTLYLLYFLTPCSWICGMLLECVFTGGVSPRASGWISMPRTSSKSNGPLPTRMS